jgi:D-alanyl-D-alanine carboxypeptidase
VLAVKSGDGAVNFKRAAGDAEPGSRFYAASITKMYTATVIMQMSDENLIDLNAPMHTYLPGLPLDGIHICQDVDYSRQITVSQLLSHTSGLADYYENGLAEDVKRNVDRSYDILDVLDMIRGQQPFGFPGSGKAWYSDTNYQLLGAIIESLAGTPLAEVFSSRIFKPLGLANTQVFGSEVLTETPLPFYYRDTRIDVPRALASMASDGGIVFTVDDAIGFLRAYFNGELFHRGNFSRIMTWAPMFFPMEYGLGLWRIKLPRWMNLFRETPELLGHSGSTGSFAYYEPSKDLYIAGTFNQIADPSRPFRLMMSVLNKIS